MHLQMLQPLWISVVREWGGPSQEGGVIALPARTREAISIIGYPARKDCACEYEGRLNQLMAKTQDQTREGESIWEESRQPDQLRVLERFKGMVEVVA